MVTGLCKKAVKNEIKNRYCNLFPFDQNLVHLEKEEEYINASWIELPKGTYILNAVRLIFQILVINILLAGFSFAFRQAKL